MKTLTDKNVRTIEMKLKQKQFQNSFETVLKLFCFSLISL